jgi:two-component system response regulator RegA
MMTGSNGDRPQLLLVDDDATLSEALGRALRARGFDVTLAHSAGEAAVVAEKILPEFAVVDLKLPDGSGLKLIPTLLRQEPRPRIVVLTGYGSIATAIDAIKLGANYYLSKPVNADDVVAAFRHEAADTDSPPIVKPMSLQRVAWEHIDRVLHQHGGNISATARALSMHRRTLQRKLSKRPVRA